MANSENYPIPAKLNLLIALVQLGLLGLIMWATGKAIDWWQLAFLSLAYGVVMNSAYAMLHEAEHNLLHPNALVNQIVGTVLAFFFPAPFHLIRQGHIGHHIRNRSDDEAFDLYFEGDNPFWKYVQLYGTLTGLFWVLIYLTNIVVLFRPQIVQSRHATFDRTTEAFIESLNPKYQRLIQLEAFIIIVLHGCMIYFWSIAIHHYLIVLFGFGFMWSAMQYAHHYGTTREVRQGAKNLRTVSLLDLIWLNHNWHLNHHMHPTVPWIYLPLLSQDGEKRGSLLMAYFRMWRGPRLTTNRVENRYAGTVIK